MPLLRLPSPEKGGGRASEPTSFLSASAECALALSAAPPALSARLAPLGAFGCSVWISPRQRIKESSSSASGLQPRLLQKSRVGAWAEKTEISAPCDLYEVAWAIEPGRGKKMFL